MRKGREAAALSNPSITGDMVSTTINQAAATLCIHDPMLEKIAEIHRSWNNGCFSGAQIDVFLSAPIVEVRLEVVNIAGICMGTLGYD